jgi:DNA processing protein
MLMTPSRSAGPAHRAEPYHAPTQIRSTRLRELLQSAQRVPEWDANKLNDFMSAGLDPAMTLFSAGDLALHNPCVSIVGKRDATAEGRARASRLARELVKQGVTIVSGLARGIDTAAHLSTLESGGRTAAVIGTPLSKASPVQNGPLQETIWRDHLLLSPFAEGTLVYPANFPQRNRVMAVLSDATIIVEADDDSGSLHQAVACQKLGRWLFILRSVVDNRKWPKRFLNVKNTAILERTGQILDALGLQ